jgi:hypothetical protein
MKEPKSQSSDILKTEEECRQEWVWIAQADALIADPHPKWTSLQAHLKHVKPSWDISPEALQNRMMNAINLHKILSHFQKLEVEYVILTEFSEGEGNDIVIYHITDAGFERLPTQSGHWDGKFVYYEKDDVVIVALHFISDPEKQPENITALKSWLLMKQLQVQATKELDPESEHANILNSNDALFLQEGQQKYKDLRVDQLQFLLVNYLTKGIVDLPEQLKSAPYNVVYESSNMRWSWNSDQSSEILNILRSRLPKNIVCMGDWNHNWTAKFGGFFANPKLNDESTQKVRLSKQPQGAKANVDDREKKDGLGSTKHEMDKDQQVGEITNLDLENPHQVLTSKWVDAHNPGNYLPAVKEGHPFDHRFVRAETNGVA